MVNTSDMSTERKFEWLKLNYTGQAMMIDNHLLSHMNMDCIPKLSIKLF